MSAGSRSLASRRGQPLDLNAGDVFTCPLCQRKLRIKVAKTGRRVGSKYTNCDNPDHDEFWRWFGANQATSSRVPQANATRSQDLNTRECRDEHCHSTLVNRHCTQVKCKRHCISSGGCSCAGHRPISAPAPVPLLASALAPALRWRGSFLDDLTSVTNDFRPPPNTITPNALELQFRASHPHWFRSLSPPPVPLSPFPISFVFVDFAHQGKPAITQAIKAYSWNWIHPGNQPYEAYSIDYFQWMPVPSGYAHDLHHQRRLLIRSRGVAGSDEDAQIAMLLAQHDTEGQLPPPTSTNPRHPPPMHHRPQSSPVTSTTSAKHRFTELKPTVPAKRRLTKLGDTQLSIKQEKLENVIVEIDDSSDEEERVRKERQRVREGMSKRMTGFKGRFRLNASEVPSTSPSPLVSPVNPTANFTFRAFEATSTSPPAGSFEYDKKNSHYPFSWTAGQLLKPGKQQKSAKDALSFGSSTQILECLNLNGDFVTFAQGQGLEASKHTSSCIQIGTENCRQSVQIASVH
ncbi:hypothetical protein B0H13DRAFT_1899638 [Mycena leptocephala]|nr:hypothetical protein B0H13DRAFT_1899638 [Mycena leptocephala]